MINWKSGYFTCGVNYGIVFSETAVKQENNDDRLSLTLKTTLIKKDSTPDSTAFSQNTSGLRLLFSLIFFFFFVKDYDIFFFFFFFSGGGWRAFQNGDFLNIFLKLWGFRDSFSYKKTCNHWWTMLVTIDGQCWFIYSLTDIFSS